MERLGEFGPELELILKSEDFSLQSVLTLYKVVVTMIGAALTLAARGSVQGGRSKRSEFGRAD